MGIRRNILSAGGGTYGHTVGVTEVELLLVVIGGCRGELKDAPEQMC